jgi:hypothetical protein
MLSLAPRRPRPGTIRRTIELNGRSISLSVVLCGDTHRLTLGPFDSSRVEAGQQRLISAGPGQPSPIAGAILRLVQNDREPVGMNLDAGYGRGDQVQLVSGMLVIGTMLAHNRANDRLNFGGRNAPDRSRLVRSTLQQSRRDVLISP